MPIMLGTRHTEGEAVKRRTQPCTGAAITPRNNRRRRRSPRRGCTTNPTVRAVHEHGRPCTYCTAYYVCIRVGSPAMWPCQCGREGPRKERSSADPARSLVSGLPACHGCTVRGAPTRGGCKVCIVQCPSTRPAYGGEGSRLLVRAFPNQGGHRDVTVLGGAVRELQGQGRAVQP